MDVYILDNLYRRTEVVDDFKSLIWTERFRDIGDFQMELDSNLKNRQRFVEGMRFSIKESYRVMVLETIEDTVDDEGVALLKLSGRSLEMILDARIARGSTNDTTVEPTWDITGTPKQVAGQIFHDICITGILDSKDVIPQVTEGTIFPEDTIPAPTDIVLYTVDPNTVYTAVKNICDIYLMGFRLVRDPVSSQLYFDIYMGSDRTRHQTVLDPVVFSTDLDNLHNTSELRSIALYKTVAYVVSPVGFQKVYPPGVDETMTGFDRKVLFVQADDITDEDPVVATAKLIQRGLEELSKNRRVSAFDGEISQTSKYIYGVDYNLGDLVQQKNKDGASNDMQVTEQIFVSDSEGDRSYPTLTVNQTVTPGSWLALPADKQWADFTDETWNDM